MINKIKIPNKNNTLSFLLLLSCTFAFAQYPATGNKQRLGYQTTGDGLVWRGRASDTVSLKSSTINNAYIIIDTVNNVMYNYIKTKGGWQFNNSDTVIVNNNFLQPVDSLFFKTSVPTNNVDTAKMRWDSDLGTIVLGMYDKVPNELGFKNFWLVKNQTGSTITKGSLVYASGTVGASGRISVSKFIANGTIDPIYLLGITAHDLTDGEDGYVISYGKIRQVNTDTFAAGAILYPSPTTAGVWTDVEPVAPNIDLPIGFCVNSSSNNGTIAIRVASGFSLSELHDVAISSPSANASLYYSGGLWRDTTSGLLVSDTAAMLTNYLRTGVAASTYLTQSNAASTYLPLTGGTLTGALNGTTGTFTGLNVTNASSEGILTLQGADNNTAERIRFNTTGSIRREIVLPTATSNLEFRTSTVGGTEGGYSFYTRRNLNAEQLAFNIDYNKDIQMYGALSVSSTTTLTGALTVNNATVLNEGSGDFDTRIESDGNANMVFVDASTDRVGIGTNTPSKTLDVVGDANISGNLTEGGNNVMTNLDTVSLSNRINGKVGLTGDDIISGTKTFNNLVNLTSNLILSGSYSQTNKLLGKNSSDGVGNITVGSGLNLTSDILTATQIDTTSLSNRINAKVGLTGNETIAGNKSFSNKIILNDSSRFEGNVLFKKNMGLPIVKISNADYTATTANHTIIYTTLTSDKTLTIPNAADAVGIKYTISIFDKPEGNEALTLITPSSNLFVRTDGENSSVDIVGGFCTVIQSDGIKWYILSYSPMY